MLLSKLFRDAPEVEINKLCTDSRQVKPGSLFFCLDGMVTNGHKFIEPAIKNGAIAIVHSEDIQNYVDGIVYIKVDNVVNTLNQVVAKFYDYPTRKMYMYGVTGTNGKSTVTNIIKNIDDHFESCGYIGTIAIRYNDVNRAPDLTTPDTISLYSILSEMAASKVDAVALEVSSHGLEQHRVDAIDFDVAIFTNLTYDHLDFHGTMENYLHAKERLFYMMKPEGKAIINIDDDKYEEIANCCSCKVYSYGVNKKCDYQATNIELGMRGSEFDLVYEGNEYHVKTNLVALYNIYNLLAAIAALHVSGHDLNEIIKLCEHIDQIEGRLEIIDEGQPFNVIVDFAHTPDGLEKVFEYAKKITKDDGNIIAVFGSAGKRDVNKRPVFGEVASKYCDMIILTEDDPRDESAREIAEEIKSGIKNGVKSIFIENRYSAIRQAIESANKNDTVLILGKGDEVFMYREDGRVPYIGDHNAAKEIIHKYILNDE